MLNENVLNFIWDCFIKSHESKDSLLEASTNFSDVGKEQILNNIYVDLNFWKEIYVNRKNNILNKVKLNIYKEIQEIDSISFHQKYGWTLAYCGLKAYLGKSSIVGNVSMEIGHRSYISGHATIKGKGTLKIGSYTSIADGLYLSVSSEDHPLSFPSSMGLSHESRILDDGILKGLELSNIKSNSVDSISVGNDVWIGRNVKIFNGVKIGDGCVIGAESLVTKDCEPFGVYVGTPAKLIRYRFPINIIEQLLVINWWNWNEKKVLKNQEFFNTDLTKFRFNLNQLIE